MKVFVFEILLKVFVFVFKYICILEYLYLCIPGFPPGMPYGFVRIFLFYFYFFILPDDNF